MDYNLSVNFSIDSHVLYKCCSFLIYTCWCFSGVTLQRGISKKACISDCITCLPLSRHTGLHGLLIDVRENAAFPQLLLAWDYRPSVFGPIYWVDWSPVVGPISIREPNRLLRNLAGGEVPWSSDWTMHEASGHCMVLSTTAPFLSLLGEDKSRYQTPGQAPPAQSICA